MTQRLTTKPEWPLIAGVVITLLAGWFAVNRWVAKVYPADYSEGERFHVITWGSDENPSRNEQIAIFNRYHFDQGTKAKMVPGGMAMQRLITTSAARNAVDISDCYNNENLRTLVGKGIAIPLNPYLKKSGMDLAKTIWPSRLDELRVPNPAFKEGDDPIDRWIWYAVPNNLSTNQAWFNRTLYQQVKAERDLTGEAMPREPWTNWTWWDYAKLARSMHRRGEDGRFLTFGAALPEFEELLLQIGLSQRGEDRAAFEALTADRKRELGIDGLSWDDCITLFRRNPDGSAIAYPNRTAVEQALQYRYDLINVLGAAPSPTDANQMQTTGGWGGGGASGQFKSGRLGLFICGRWFLCQARGDIAFDWHVFRMPRWVPYDEWARWEKQGLKPEDRDGAWGEKEHPQRGYGSFLGGRTSIITSSCRDPERAFSFLRFLVENRDYNTALLIEDGMGANIQMAYDYLSKPDPLFPREVTQRAPEQEMATLANLLPHDLWPYTNSDTAKNAINSNIDSDLNRRELLQAPVQPGERTYEYAVLTGDPTTVGRASVGAILADRVREDADRQLSLGVAIDRPGRPAYAPNAATWTLLMLGIGGLATALIQLRRRRA